MVQDYFSSSQATFSSEQLVLFDSLSVALLAKVASTLEATLKGIEKPNCTDLNESALSCLTDPKGILLSLATNHFQVKLKTVSLADLKKAESQREMALFNSKVE